jgi:hypothetical protein
VEFQALQKDAHFGGINGAGSNRMGLLHARTPGSHSPESLAASQPHMAYDHKLSSPALQQHLFFTSTHQSSAHESQWTKNPLLAEKFPAFFRDICITSHFFVDVNDIYEPDHLGPYKRYHFHHIRHLEKSDCASCPDAYSGLEASWRRMPARFGTVLSQSSIGLSRRLLGTHRRRVLLSTELPGRGSVIMQIQPLHYLYFHIHIYSS